MSDELIQNTTQVKVDWPKFNNRATIENFLTEMSKQDNRATASPFYYVIMTGYDQILPEGHGGNDKFYCSDLENDFDSMEELYACAVDNGRTMEEAEKLSVREYSVERKFREECMFLTESEANRHFKLNRYHYTHDAYVYLKHAWRAPQLEEFFNALFDEYGIERQKR